MTATLIIRTEAMLYQGVHFLRRHAYLLAVAVLAGALLSVLIPELASAKCQPEGVPERAGAGVPGLLDHRESTMEGDSLYGDYGYAGLTWHACDLGGPIAGNEWAGDPDAMMDTKVGNAGLGLAKWLAAAATGLHSWNADTTAVLQPMDTMITDLSAMVRTLVVDDWMILFIVLAAIALFAWAMTSEVRKTMMTVGAFLASIGFLAVVGTAPLTVAHAIDDVGSSVTNTADQRALSVAGIDAEPSEAIGAIMNDRILYPLWAKGALGKDDQTAPGEDTWANQLYHAGATNYDESDVDPQDKKDEYEDIYDSLGDSEDPALQQYMKGQGYNRAGIGLATLIQSGLVSIVRIASEALIFASKLIFRFVPIIGPVFAVLGVWHVTRGVAKEGLNMLGAAVINVAIFGVFAALHTALIAFLSNNMDFAPMLFVSALVTFVFWKFTRPFRSLTQMVTPASMQNAMHKASNLNPLTALLSAWALLNTGRSNRTNDAQNAPQDDPDEPPRENHPDRPNPSTRHHTTNTGPDYSTGRSDIDGPAELPAAPSPRPIEPGGGSQALEIEHRYEERSPEIRPASDVEIPEQELHHTVGHADAEASNQRRDDHGERIMADRIIAAIDRSKSDGENRHEATAGGQSGEVLRNDQRVPDDIVRLDHDPNSGVYFNPRVDAQTSTRVNQHIFVPGNQTHYERTDTETDAVVREREES